MVLVLLTAQRELVLFTVTFENVTLFMMKIMQFFCCFCPSQCSCQIDRYVWMLYTKPSRAKSKPSSVFSFSANVLRVVVKPKVLCCNCTLGSIGIPILGQNYCYM